VSELTSKTTTDPHYCSASVTGCVVGDVIERQLAAMVSTVKAFEATLLPAAMNYGPPAACAWAMVQVLKALRGRLRMIVSR
jgi:hypothetical protein